MFVCFMLIILPIYSSFNNCSYNFSKFNILHVYWLHFIFTCECFLQDLKSSLYSDWTAKMLFSSCLIPLTLWTLPTNVNCKKCNCVLHPTIEIVSENHTRTKAQGQTPAWSYLKYPPVWQRISTNYYVGYCFSTTWSHIFSWNHPDHISLAYENGMQSSVESPIEVRIYQIFCLLLCCYPVILSKKEIRLMWLLLTNLCWLFLFTLLSSWCFQLDCLIICWCVFLTVFNWAIIPRSSSSAFLKTVTIFALLRPLEPPPYLTKPWTQSLMVQRLLHIDHYSLVAEYHLAL